MKLAELAFACYVYSGMTDYDSSYLQFLKKTKPQLDLSNEQHCMALLKWLNDRGCRQFAIAYHGLASEEMQKLVYREQTLFAVHSQLMSNLREA